MTPAKKRRNSWIAILILAAPFLWTIPTYFYLSAQTKSRNSACESTLKSLGNALLADAQENSGRLPDAKNWIAVATEGSSATLRCPADTDTTHPSSYAMNANLSGKKLSEIKNPSEVVLLYETTNKESTPAGVGKDLVNLGKDKAGQGRHNLVAYRFNFYVMADGTIRQAGTIPETKKLRWTP